MVHVHDDEWVDVVRGTLPADRAAAVAAHLEQGCLRCLRAQELWLAVAQSAAREHLYAPPTDTVRIARASFEGRERTERVPLWATLVFDSLKEAGAGVRGFTMRPRHLLFQAGTLSIDMRLIASRGSIRHVLIGQVADAERPDEGCGGCRVEVLAGDHTLETTSTNGVGEFEVHLGPEPNVSLLVSVADGRAVQVHLGEVMPGR